MTGIASSKPLNIVAVSGGLNTPSKTESLVQPFLMSYLKQLILKFTLLN
jgi:hypothetical protein